MKVLRDRIRRFFFPPSDSPRWILVLPYAVLIVLGLSLFGGGIPAWEYTNSTGFCGGTCHTMPPQNTAFLRSAHSNVSCEDCHVGRASFFTQFARKTGGLRELYSMTFKLYEYPIQARHLQPAVDTCEKCHRPDTLSAEKLLTIAHFGDSPTNPRTNIKLAMKTGGGTELEGYGAGIHWHTQNQVYYYATDSLDQVIPYVRLVNADGSMTEFVDIDSGFNVSNLDEGLLKQMDCTTCHNRITHNFKTPADSVDESMARGAISPEIPDIHKRAVEILSTTYATRAEAMQAIDDLEEYYKSTTYYPGHGDQIHTAIEEMKAIYDRTVFHDQKIDWTTHPNNIGHFNSPGCYRCHDGKHLNNRDQAVRLECNLCHTIPTVSSEEDPFIRLEINNRTKPESHLNANWINLHFRSFNYTCAKCHTIQDLGGVSNTSFCSNSACHGSVFTFAGFDSPKLREILELQIPTPPPAP